MCLAAPVIIPSPWSTDLHRGRRGLRRQGGWEPRDREFDLWGTWVGGGPIGDIERDGGMKPGELDTIMQPWAIALRNSRKDPEDPHNFCLPMGVPRQAGAFPWRFVQYPTHKAATHMFILWEGFRNTS